MVCLNIRVSVLVLRLACFLVLKLFLFMNVSDVELQGSLRQIFLKLPYGNGSTISIALKMACVFLKNGVEVSNIVLYVA